MSPVLSVFFLTLECKKYQTELLKTREKSQRTKFKKKGVHTNARRPLLVSTKLALNLQLEIFGFIVFMSYFFVFIHFYQDGRKIDVTKAQKSIFERTS